MTPIRVLLFPLLAGAVLAGAQQASAPQPSSPAPRDTKNSFVGSQACKACHPDVWAKFYKNPHYASIASGKEAPEDTGCESCHGPGGAHVEARGGKATIRAFSELQPKQVM